MIVSPIASERGSIASGSGRGRRLAPIGTVIPRGSLSMIYGCGFAEAPSTLGAPTFYMGTSSQLLSRSDFARGRSQLTAMRQPVCRIGLHSLCAIGDRLGRLERTPHKRAFPDG